MPPVDGAAFMVDVVRWSDDGVERSVGPATQCWVERVEARVLRDLDGERFYTSVRRATPDEQKGWRHAD